MSDIKESTAARNAQIIDEFYGDEASGEAGLSLAALARNYGLDRSTVQKLIKVDAGRSDVIRERLVKPRDPRVLNDKKPISSIHYRIGARVGRYMAEHNLLPTQFGELIHKSRVVVRNMQVGAYDLSLSEIVTLGQVLDIPYEELVLGKAKEAPIVHS